MNPTTTSQTGQTNPLVLNQHKLSYEYPTQFASPHELLHFLYQDEGVCPSLFTSLIASNQVELLTDLVCLILSRNPPPAQTNNPPRSPSSIQPGTQQTSSYQPHLDYESQQSHYHKLPDTIHDLPAGTRYGELYAIEVLGINMGQIPITPTYYGPLVALTGTTTMLSDIQKIKPELIDFFRILRSSTNWTAATFAQAVQTSELNKYKQFLDQYHNFLSPADRHIMICTKAYELAFYQPFLIQSNTLPTSPTTPSSIEINKFLTPPTIQQYVNQSFHFETAVNEFLMWTGFHSQSIPYQHQIQQFIGSTLINSWQYIISNIITLIKHFYLACNINFIFWIFQTFFPRYLYSQIAPELVLETMNELHDRTVHINELKEIQFQELQTFLLNTSTTAPSLHPTDPSASIPPPSSLINDTNLQHLQNHHSQQILEIESKVRPYNFLLTTRALLIGSFIVSLNECSLEQFYYLEHLDHIQGEIIQLEQIQQEFNSLQPSPSALLSPQPSPRSKLPLKLLKRSAPSRFPFKTSSRPNQAKLHPDDNSTDDDTNDAYTSSIPKSRVKEQRLAENIAHSKKLPTNSKANRPTTITTSNNNSTNNNNNNKKNGPHNDDDNQPRINGRTLNEVQLDLDFNRQLADFYQLQYKYAVAVHNVLFFSFKFNFTLPSHLIALYLCGMLYKNEDLCLEISKYGLTSTSTSSQVDNTGRDPLLQYDLGLYQRTLRQLLHLSEPQQQHQQQQNSNESILQFVNPLCPAFLSTDSLCILQSQQIEPGFLIQFSIHAVKAYFAKHLKIRYGTLDLCLRLLGRRSLGLAITRLVNIAKKPLPDLVFAPPLSRSSNEQLSSFPPFNSNHSSQPPLTNQSQQSQLKDDYANLQHFLIDVVSSTNRCTLPFLDFLLNIGCPFTIDTEKYHYSSNILFAILTTPYLNETKRFIFIDLIIKFAMRRYRTIPKLTTDVFFYILHSVWSFRNLCGTQSKLLAYVFSGFVDQLAWEQRLRGPDVSKNLINSIKFLFSTEVETQTQRIIVSQTTLPQISIQRQLMYEIYQYLLPQSSQGTKLLFSNHTIMVQDKTFREFILRPIFTIGSTSAFEYILRLGYPLDPLDFTRLLSHSSRVLDYRDCINVYSVVKSFYLHLYLLKAKHEAVNTIELQQLEQLNNNILSSNKTYFRNRSGFESFILQRFPGQLYDFLTLSTGLKASEEMFQSMLDLSSQGIKYSTNEPLADSDIMAYFKNASLALDYIPTSPQLFQQLCCEIDKQPESTTNRLNKIISSSQPHHDDEEDNSSSSSSDISSNSSNFDTTSNNNNASQDSRTTRKEAEKHIFTVDTMVFEALNHYHTHICSNDEAKSTLVEFLLIFRRHLENFYKHLVGSLLIYRTSYSFQSPLLYNILRCLLPRLDLYPAQICFLLVDKFRSFDFIQQFNYQSLVVCFLEDTLCTTLKITPAQLQYLLTPPISTTQTFNNIPQFPESFEQSAQPQQLDPTLELLINPPHSGIDEYNTITMSIDERERYRSQMSEIIQALLICILLQRSKKYPQTMKPHASCEYPQYCFDSFKVLYHFLKFIPLPSISRYSTTVKSFNYKDPSSNNNSNNNNNNDDIPIPKNPSPPGIKPQFLFFLMQTIPTTNQIFYNELLDLYVQQNGIIFNSFYHFHSLSFPHLFPISTFDLIYYRYFLHTLKFYQIPIITFTDALWRDLLLQSIQHSQFPTQNEHQLIQFAYEYLQVHQKQVDLYSRDYINANNFLAKKKSSNGSYNQSQHLKRLIRQKWEIKSLNHIQPLSHTTDITGSNLFFWLSGMNFSPRLCLAMIALYDHFLFKHHTLESSSSFLYHLLQSSTAPSSPPSLLPQYISSHLFSQLASRSLRKLPSPLIPSLNYLNNKFDTEEYRPKNDFQQSGPDLPELPFPLSQYPTILPSLSPTTTPVHDNNHDALSSEQHLTSELSTHSPTSLPIPMLPFSTLFHKDHSGRTILHHMVENTEINPNLIQLFACSAINPFEHYNFNHLYATSTPQMIPYLSTPPKGLDLKQYHSTHSTNDSKAAQYLLNQEHINAVNKESSTQLQPNEQPNDPSVGVILSATTILKDNQPPIPILLTLDSSISQQYDTQSHLSPLQQRIDQEVYPVGNNDIQLIETMQKMHLLEESKLIQQYFVHKNQQNLHLESNPNQLEELKSQLLSSNVLELHQSELLPLYYRTIYSTDSSLLFWLSYIRLYCQLANPIEANSYLQSIQPQKPRHFLSYRKAVLLRQIRHRFPFTLPVSPEELQELIDIQNQFKSQQSIIKKSTPIINHIVNEISDDDYDYDDEDDDEYDDYDQRQSTSNHKNTKGKNNSHYNKKMSPQQRREAKKQLKLENKQRRAIVGLGATILGLAIATIGYFWLTSSAHQDDEDIEPVGEIATYSYTKDHDNLVKGKKRRK